MKIERINKNNYQSFYNKFSKIKDFKVSKKILFYEQTEIKEWIKNPKQNLLYGIFTKDVCVGFCFCKIISNHWALIDNFYVCEAYRRYHLGSKLQKYVEKKLRHRGIKYISRVTKKDNIVMQRFLNRTGYKSVGDYVWFEKFL